MYIPEAFEVTDPEEIFSFVEENAFGQLISMTAGRLTSTHLPFLLSEDRTTLTGHLARCNPQSNDLHGQEVLVTLQGQHGYISPSWYTRPSVPTWNYQAVHIYGCVEVFECRKRLRHLVDALSKKYESSVGESWQGQYAESMLGAIAGFEVKISEIQCKYKLSQNRPVEDRRGVISRLREQGSMKLAKTMEEFDV